MAHQGILKRRSHRSFPQVLRASGCQDAIACRRMTDRDLIVGRAASASASARRAACRTGTGRSTAVQLYRRACGMRTACGGPGARSPAPRARTLARGWPARVTRAAFPVPVNTAGMPISLYFSLNLMPALALWRDSATSSCELPRHDTMPMPVTTTRRSLCHAHSHVTQRAGLQARRCLGAPSAAASSFARRGLHRAPSVPMARPACRLHWMRRAAARPCGFGGVREGA